MRTAGRRAAVCAVLIACMAPAAWSQALASHHACVLADGSLRVFEHDVTQRFGAAVRACTPVSAPASSVLPPLPADFVDDEAVRVIRAPLASPSAMPASTEYDALIASTAQRHGVDAQLLAALVRVESNFNAQAVSPKGAVGLMQVMPATAARFGVRAGELQQPQVNLDVGTRYLRWLAETFDGRLDLQLAAYNAGEGAVLRHGRRVPPFPETQAYVRKVLDLYRRP